MQEVKTIQMSESINAYLVTLKVNQDDRGNLVELMRNTWCDKLKVPKMSQVYSVINESANVIRGLHRHKELFDYFTIVAGKAKFILVQNDDMILSLKVEDKYLNYDNSKIETFILSDKLPQVLVVPPTIWHGWQSLTNNTIMVSIASHEYNSSKPDEQRVAWDCCGEDIWGVKYK